MDQIHGRETTLSEEAELEEFYQQDGRRIQLERAKERFATLTEEIEENFIKGRLGSQLSLNFREWKELHKQLELNLEYREQDINSRHKVILIGELRIKKLQAKIEAKETELQKHLEQLKHNSLKMIMREDKMGFFVEPEKTDSEESGRGSIENESPEFPNFPAEEMVLRRRADHLKLKDNQLNIKLHQVHEYLKEKQDLDQYRDNLEKQGKEMTKEVEGLRVKLRNLTLENDRLRSQFDNRINIDSTDLERRQADLVERERVFAEELKEFEDNKGKFISQFEDFEASQNEFTKQQEDVKSKWLEQHAEIDEKTEKLKADAVKLKEFLDDIEQREADLSEKMDKMKTAQEELEKTKQELELKEIALLTGETQFQIAKDNFESLVASIEKEKKEIGGMKVFYETRDQTLRSWAKTLMDMKSKVYNDQRQFRDAVDKIITPSLQEIPDFANEPPPIPTSGTSSSSTSEPTTPRTPFKHHTKPFYNRDNHQQRFFS